ncbi:Hypothetical predicted protein [Olea europaea subsp. europaea]|uniref:Uncharacterized protein n=1 Tax=Olea europaea subsp. europaea TaxID=158383 RepID=A0A8S0SFU5_OLEEU|nr:Hypothetical predicted protein [Olea europaea subsp. europaea]
MEEPGDRIEAILRSNRELADSNRGLAESDHELTGNVNVLSELNRNLVETVTGLTAEVRRMREEINAMQEAARGRAEIPQAVREERQEEEWNTPRRSPSPPREQFQNLRQYMRDRQERDDRRWRDDRRERDREDRMYVGRNDLQFLFLRRMDETGLRSTSNPVHNTRNCTNQAEMQRRDEQKATSQRQDDRQPHRPGYPNGRQNVPNEREDRRGSQSRQDAYNRQESWRGGHDQSNRSDRDSRNVRENWRENRYVHEIGIDHGEENHNEGNAAGSVAYRDAAGSSYLSHRKAGEGEGSSRPKKPWDKAKSTRPRSAKRATTCEEIDDHIISLTSSTDEDEGILQTFPPGTSLDKGYIRKRRPAKPLDNETSSESDEYVPRYLLRHELNGKTGKQRTGRTSKEGAASRTLKKETLGLRHHVTRPVPRTILMLSRKLFRHLTVRAPLCLPQSRRRLCSPCHYDAQVHAVSATTTQDSTLFPPLRNKSPRCLHSACHDDGVSAVPANTTKESRFVRHYNTGFHAVSATTKLESTLSALCLPRRRRPRCARNFDAGVPAVPAITAPVFPHCFPLSARGRSR